MWSAALVLEDERVASWVVAASPAVCGAPTDRTVYDNGCLRRQRLVLMFTESGYHQCVDAGFIEQARPTPALMPSARPSAPPPGAVTMGGGRSGRTDASRDVCLEGVQTSTDW